MDPQYPVRSQPSQNGFTLIELLVVVAIIAILAAIAVPNFLEAQTRAKVARAKSEMRTLAVAVELYQVDWNAYPLMAPSGEGLYANFMYFEAPQDHLQHHGGCPDRLTTPVAYLSSPPPLDPFSTRTEDVKDWTCGVCGKIRSCSYFYYNFKGAARTMLRQTHRIAAPAPMRFNGPDGSVYPADWAMITPGPDRTFLVKNPSGEPWLSWCVMWKPTPLDNNWNALTTGRFSLYDPSNGSTSAGDIWRTNQGSIP